MSFIQTKEYRSLIQKKERLEQEQHLPPARHLIYLIDDYIGRKIELEKLRMELAQVEDKIYCAKEFIKMVQQGK